VSALTFQVRLEIIVVVPSHYRIRCHEMQFLSKKSVAYTPVQDI
jgi:hypothetical protein